MILRVCEGVECNPKGAYDVIKVFKRLIEQHKVEDKIELVPCHCLARCTEDGISVKAGNNYIKGVSYSNAEEKFLNEILPLAE